MKEGSLQARASLLRTIREFFHHSGVLEVTTPVCSQGTATDPAIEPFSTRYTGPGFADGVNLYLHTSPELPMKRLLAAGSGSIYQICQVFRNGELGRLHNPEFTLLEWYRTGVDHHALMDDLAALIRSCLGHKLAVEKVTYRELFLRRLEVDPLTATVSELRQQASRAGVPEVTGLDNEQRDSWLDLLMTHVLEPELGIRGLTFVYDYPASQASLARLNANDCRVASRFELYFQGIELANGFHELANAQEQRERFMADNRQRAKGGQAILPLDERFLQALEWGLPDCAGVAVGLDRLLMLQTGASSLKEVMPFPLPQA